MEGIYILGIIITGVAFVIGFIASLITIWIAVANKMKNMKISDESHSFFQ